MRTLERWHKFLFARIVEENFPPRLQNDLKSLTWPDLPQSIGSTFIFGPTNFGKTVYAAFMLLQWNQNNYMDLITEPKKCFFVSVPEFFNTIKESFDKKDESYHKYFTSLRDCDLLVLDDIGIKNPGDWGMELLYMLINYRYEYLKTTIITSNLDLQQLADLFGDDRIVSRIQRMGKIIQKTDWRKKS